jgi:hypothetical protein
MFQHSLVTGTLCYSFSQTNCYCALDKDTINMSVQCLICLVTEGEYLISLGTGNEARYVFCFPVPK